MKVNIDIFNKDSIPKEIYDIIKKFEDDLDSKTKENNIDNSTCTTYASTNAPLYVPIAEHSFNISRIIM